MGRRAAAHGPAGTGARRVDGARAPPVGGGDRRGVGGADPEAAEGQGALRGTRFGEGTARTAARLSSPVDGVSGRAGGLDAIARSPPGSFRHHVEYWCPNRRIYPAE
ncbi:hypothetical protein GCM10010249_28470 [Streptomyces roseolilacinus]|uniref:Uncharacterized protein n=1 Tax=Streptomyces roseolilacinus TaxID=66904 RepID=A0A918AZU7_9ACTN|nr:hypothetical protein GCM10010249_28470 [Streptomyces roseolilacinus]